MKAGARRDTHGRLSCKSSGTPPENTRVADDTNCAVAHGGLGDPVKPHPAMTYGALNVTVGCPPTITRGLTAVGCACPA